MAKTKLHVTTLIGLVVLATAVGLSARSALRFHEQPSPTPRSPYPNNSCYALFLGTDDPSPTFPDPSAVPVGTVGGPTDYSTRVISVDLRDTIDGVHAWNGVYVVVYVWVEYTGILTNGAATGPWSFIFIGNDAVRVCADDTATTALDQAVFPSVVNGANWNVTIMPGQPVQYYMAFDVARTVVPGSYLSTWSHTKLTKASLDLGLT